ncbi:MAG: helix-turn-helix domain-containing protein [Methanomassiliicoccales archaeon]|nr:helix-turn-helix domain-containing protein [Methanomassiliicoccales archaeon]
MNTPVDGLMRLGLTEYEARAYVAMVTIGEGGITEISQQSGMPRSRVYDIMERLAKKGFVEVGGMKPLRYRAVDPDKVTSQIRAELTRTADTVQSNLKDLRRRTDSLPTPLWFIQGEGTIDMEIKDFIGKSQSPIEMLVMSNSLLLKHLAEITERSKSVRVDVVVANEPEGFRGLMGKARLMSMPSLKATSLDWLVGTGFPMTDWERRVRNELVIVSGSNSMLVYKEEETRRAIRVEGTIIGQFIFSFVDRVFHEAEPLEQVKR